MIKKALIVEDDPHVLGYIEDTLCSLNHEHVWVTNQHDARQRFQEERFDYVLLDLQIPAKPNRGGASKQYGVNLLREILGKPPRRDLAGHHHDSLYGRWPEPVERTAVLWCGGLHCQATGNIRTIFGAGHRTSPRIRNADPTA